MSVTMTDEHLYTVEELAKRLRVTGRTIRRMIDDGELGAIRVRNQYRISQSALDAYVRTHSYPQKEDEEEED